VYESRLQDARAIAYEDGLTDGMRIATAPPGELFPDRSNICASEESIIARYRQTEAANRENARAQ
jgi:hypothetical protein